LAILVPILLGYLYYAFSFRPLDSFQGIYMVPEDAVYIVETFKPIENWEQISRSEPWQFLKQNAYFAELTRNANEIDQVIQNNKKIFSFIGSRQILVSAHVHRPNDYDFLYIVDLQEVSRLAPLKSWMKKLTGEGYRLNFRNFQDQEILELTNVATKETLYMSFVKNLLLLSYTHTLVENSIRQMENPVIGRDLNFQEVYRNVSEKGMMKVYFQYRVFNKFLKVYTGEDDEAITALSKQLLFTAMSLDLDRANLISLEGYTNIAQDVPSYLLAMQKTGKGKLSIARIAPQRTGLYMSLGFNGFRNFYEKLEETYQKDPAFYKEYMDNMDQIERFLNINIQEHFFDWIDNEVAFIQTQPTGLGRENEFAMVLKAKSGKKAQENLDFISRQIRRKTPVKFKTFAYKGYNISFLSIKGFFRLMLGKLFSKLERPYYTIIDDFVIFSNHPQTLKSIIDDYTAGRTLEKHDNYRSFSRNFNTASNIFIYIQTPVYFNNLRGYVNAETWKDLQTNRKYFTNFSDMGFQLTSNGNTFETRLKVQFRDEDALKALNELLASAPTPDLFPLDSLLALTRVDAEEIFSIDDISPEDLNAKKYEEKHPNGELKLEVGLRDGLKQGPYREYDEAGNLLVKGRFKNDQRDGIWRFYDANGRETARKRYRDGKEL
jgi:hypothetical protein